MKHNEAKLVGYPHQRLLPSREDYGPSDAQRAALLRQFSRWKLLSAIVPLEMMACDVLFEKTPLTRWQLQKRGFGEFSKRREARIQTADDKHMQEVQTDGVSAEQMFLYLFSTCLLLAVAKVIIVLCRLRLRENNAKCRVTCKKPVNS